MIAAFLITTFLLPLTYLPLIIPFSLFYFVFTRRRDAFLLILIFGMILDIFLFNPIGFTPLYLSILLFLASLYSRKFEVATPNFLGAFSLLGTFIYLSLLSYPPLLASIFCFLLSLLIYAIISIVRKKTVKKAHIAYG